MKKIMLCCSAGMSTSLLVKKMLVEAEKRGLAAEIKAFGASEFDDQMPITRWSCWDRRSSTCNRSCKPRRRLTASRYNLST